ncbi:MAG TPA: hypothetical protein DCW74_19010 [Alteromonas australica]|uniref:Uncharacterized protein n=1 Tax=Alteromonas australica TaxID=589873 RepID=A0A350P944_9ALTE|nr:hypothetical protein [Alteromonas australica]
MPVELGFVWKATCAALELALKPWLWLAGFVGLAPSQVQVAQALCVKRLGTHLTGIRPHGTPFVCGQGLWGQIFIK